MRYKKGQIINRANKRWKIIDIGNIFVSEVDGSRGRWVQARNLRKDGTLGKYILGFWSDKPISTTKIVMIGRGYNE